VREREGLQKSIKVLDRFDTYKGGGWIEFNTSFLYISGISDVANQICIKTMSVKGGLYAYEAYEATKIKNTFCYVFAWY
jgi:hypothetical protein